MIGRLAAIVLLAGAGAPAALAQTLPPDVQEMVDKVHLVDSGKLAAVEELPAVFERNAQDNLRHKPSGYVCQHTRASLDGLMPGFVSIFDDPAIANDIGCGMIGRGINISMFIWKGDGDPQSVIGGYVEPAKKNIPPAEGVAPVTPATAADLELAAGLPLAGEAWTDRDGLVQHVYIIKVGDWFVTGRLTVDPMMSREGLRHVGRQFEQARTTIGT